MEPVPVTEVMSRRGWVNAHTARLEGQLQQVRMIKEAGHPPMTVVTASTLRKLWRLPRSDEGHAEDLEALLLQHGKDSFNSPRLITVLFSHRWIRPDIDPAKAHPDDEAGAKAKVMVEFADWLMWFMTEIGNGTLAEVTVEPMEVAFWLDWNSVDQEDVWPGVKALPLYVGACSVFAYFNTPEYEPRCWTRVERVMAYAFSNSGDTQIAISPGFTHRKQLGTTKGDTRLPDPLAKDAGITKQEDRAPVAELLETAKSSNTFSCWRVFVRGCTADPWTCVALNVCLCCQWCGCMAWLSSRSLRLGEVIRTFNTLFLE